MCVQVIEFVVVCVLGMSGSTGTAKVPVFIYFKRYAIIILHQFGIRCSAKYTCRWQCSQMLAQPVKCDNRTTDGSNRLKLPAHPNNNINTETVEVIIMALLWITNR